MSGDWSRPLRPVGRMGRTICTRGRTVTGIWEESSISGREAVRNPPHRSDSAAGTAFERKQPGSAILQSFSCAIRPFSIGNPPKLFLFASISSEKNRSLSRSREGPRRRGREDRESKRAWMGRPSAVAARAALAPCRLGAHFRRNRSRAFAWDLKYLARIRNP